MSDVQLSDPQKQLVLEHVGFARWYSRKYATTLGAAESFAVCCLALVDCALKWDESRDVKFTTYSGKAMGHALSAAYKQKTRANTTLREGALASPAEDGGELFNWLNTRGVEIASEHAYDVAILMGYLEGVSTNCIARRCGVVGRTITERRQKLFARLRRIAEQEGIL